MTVPCWFLSCIFFWISTGQLDLVDVQNIRTGLLNCNKLQLSKSQGNIMCIIHYTLFFEDPLIEDPFPLWLKSWLQKVPKSSS